MFLNSFKNKPKTPTVSQYFSYQKPTLSSLMSTYEQCKRFKPESKPKSSNDVSYSPTKSKNKYKTKPTISYYETKIMPLKVGKIVHLSNTSKSEINLNGNSEDNNLTVTDDENFEDDYIEVNPLSTKYGEDITKLNKKSNRQINKSGFSTNASSSQTPSRNGSAFSIKKSEQSKILLNTFGSRSNSRKIDSKKRFKNTMKRLMKPMSNLNNNYEANSTELSNTYEVKPLRFTSFLSVDAQLAFLKTYEDMIHTELTYIYPFIQSIPRTTTARSIYFNLIFNFSNKDYNPEFLMGLRFFLLFNSEDT